MWGMAALRAGALGASPLRWGRSTMYSEFFEMENRVERHLVNDEFSSALDQITAFVVSVMNEQLAPGELIGSKRLDQLCELVGLQYARYFKISGYLEREFCPEPGKIAIICTGLYRYGGTSLVIGDLIKAHQGSECSVLVTDSLSDMSEAELAMSRIGDTSADVIMAPRGDSASKLGWLIQQLIRLAPSRILLLNHHQDSVAIAAASSFVDRTKVLFYHHADHNLCLGVHLRGAIHVDPHNVGYCNCRRQERVDGNVYLPMAVDDQGSDRTGGPFLRDDDLITCSSATYHKFKNYYLYPYVDLIAERLVRRGGVHLHIGNIPPSDKRLILSKLAARKVEPERFVHIPWVPRLWPALVERRVDLFIGSFPLGGARTLIEAMGAGLPILMSESYLSRYHSSRDIVYPDHFVWKFPSDFIDIIENVSAESLREHSRRSREHFVSYYSSDTVNVGAELDHICSGSPQALAPPLYDYDPDALDRVLHFSRIERLNRGEAVANAAMQTAHSVGHRIGGVVGELIQKSVEAELASGRPS